MLDKICLSQDRCSAVIHFDTHVVTVSCDHGRVTELLWMLFPDMDIWQACMEKTQPIIDLKRYDDAA